MPRANNNTGTYVMFLLLLRAGFSAAKQVGYAFMPYYEHKPFGITTSSNQVSTYLVADTTMDLATAQINGRYPDTGYVVNRSCKELCYVLSGQGTIVTKEESYTLQTGDVILLEAGEPYYWQGTLEVLTTCNPHWHAEQHQRLEV